MSDPYAGWGEVPAEAYEGWAEVPAGPRRQFTGKRERQLEDEKLVDSLGIDSDIPGVKWLTQGLSKLGLGVGHGMDNALTNIGDLMGRLPGLERPNANLWQNDDELYQRLLGGSDAAEFGNLTGGTAAALPAAIATGGLASAALPAAAVGAAPVVASGAEGALMNALMAHPSEQSDAAQTGLGWGAGIPAALQVARAVLPRPLRALARAGTSLVMPGASAEARELALKAGAVRPFRTAEDVAARTAQIRENEGATLAELVRQMEAGGGQGVELAPLLESLGARADDAARTMRAASANAYPRTAARLAANAEGRPRLSLSQGEAIKRSLQEGIPYGKPGAKEAVRVQKDIASMFREAQEQAVAQAARQSPELASLAAQYVPQKQRVGAAIEGAKAAAKAAKPGLYGRLGDLMALGGAASAGMAHHGPAGALWSVPAWALEHAVRTRGPNTLAATAYGLGNALEGPTLAALLNRPLPLTQAMQVGRRSLSDLLPWQARPVLQMNPSEAR